MENFGEKILMLRTEKNVSQEKLAQSLNVARYTVSRWETNASTPSTENVKNLCAFFGVDLEYFLKEDGEPVATAVPVGAVSFTERSKKAPAFKTVKILSAVAGLVLFALLVTACAITAYIFIAPNQGGKDVVVLHNVNYNGVILLIVAVVSFAVFITLLILLIIKAVKSRTGK